MLCDVVVVGGGPAGASAALLLARSGARVCVIERARFPRVKACGEYLSCAAVALLGDLGVRGRLESAAAPLDGVRLTNGVTQASLAFSAPAWSLPRATLDAALLEAALDEGAVCVVAAAERIAHERDGVRVQARAADGTALAIEARILIGADGAQSLVARQAGLSMRVLGRRRFAVGGHYAGLDALPNRVQMFVRGRSYVAINPLRDREANVMCIVGQRELRANAGRIDAYFADLAASLSRGRIRFQTARRIGKRIAVGPLEHRTRHVCASHILLAGDAVQLLDPFTGQGVYLALCGGRLAARAALAALADPRCEAQAWRRYGEEMRAILTRRSRLCALTALLVRVPLVSSAAGALAAAAPSVMRPLLDAVTGAA